MSVFGGDSWAREAQCRKRRVDELMVDNIDSSAYKKLSSGKFVCIVCSHRPVLDTPLMLSQTYRRSQLNRNSSQSSSRQISGYMSKVQAIEQKRQGLEKEN